MSAKSRPVVVANNVAPEERPAAASVTAVPKDLRQGGRAMISGYLLTLSSFGWPLLIGGVIKGVFDILLLVEFQTVRPPEEIGTAMEYVGVPSLRRETRRIGL